MSDTLEIANFNTLLDASMNALKIKDAEIAELTDKAIRFDLDQAGIERREAESVELVGLRAQVSALKARVEELEAILRETGQALNASVFNCREHAKVCAGVWVPVGEKSPPSSGMYWCLLANGKQDEFWYGGTHRQWDYSRYGITHWFKSADVKLPGEQR